jgi:uncharacterized protein (DUF362 family)
MSNNGSNSGAARVGLTRLEKLNYDHAEVSDAVSRVAECLNWSDAERGPFGRLVHQNSRVLIKPNLVLHKNLGSGGMEPMVTHLALIKAAADAALQAGAAEVVVGDAPIQSCDFDQLLDVTGLGQWSADLTRHESRFKGVRDFRRTICKYVDGVRVATENIQPEELFVLFDLGADSLLEPITDDNQAFRVTCYDPRLLAQTHAPGRHQYLVARDVIDADIVINLPKLKTHQKAGITCALKNLIGINGNKEYLPHHRLGGADQGGDCYPESSAVKRALEYVSDRQNTTDSHAMGKLWQGLGTQLNRVLHLANDRTGIEGSWSGNDTIWRTGLDLNRILLYGTGSGDMAVAQQRRVVHLVDAVVAGQGNGPLSPLPLELGVVFAGESAVAVDWVGAQLLGYDPRRVSIVREAFNSFKWPLAAYAPNDITLTTDNGTEASAQALASSGLADTRVIYPAGWSDAAAE